jgi:hypothetical protein
MIVGMLAIVMHKKVVKAVKVDHSGPFHCLFFMFYAQKYLITLFYYLENGLALFGKWQVLKIWVRI